MFKQEKVTTKFSSSGLVLYFVVKRHNDQPFRHQGVPAQFPGTIMRSAPFSPAPTSEEDRLAEMSFMQYEDDDDGDEDDSTEKLNDGVLHMKL